MKKEKNSRLDKLEARIWALPITPKVVRSAYKRFQETGELPEHQRVADAVIRRARMGAKLADELENEQDESVRLRISVAEHFRTVHHPKDPVMDALYDEAVWAPEPLRWAARQVLRSLASKGIDPTTPAYVGTGIAEVLPDHPGVGLFILGYPDRLAKTPYVKQANRLFARCAKLRERIPHDDRRWSDRLSDASQRFQLNGDLPDDELLLDSVLALSEQYTLMEHEGGEDVRDLMAAFDAAAREKGEERMAAITRLQELVKEGRLLGAQE